MVYQSTWDLIGFAAASFLLTCLVVELYFIYKTVNMMKLKKKSELEESQKVIFEVFCDGFEESRVKTAWFVRNYQVLSLTKYFSIVFFLVNFQYLQLLQVCFTIIVLVGFTVLTFIHHIGGGLFKSKWEGILNLIQEASMSIMILLVGVFWIDSIKHFFSNAIKQRLALFVILLFVLNIVV